MNSLLSNIFFGLIISNVFCITLDAKCHPDDEYGMLAFKSGITADPSGLLSTWKAGTDCCSTWAGVQCGNSNPRSPIRVVSINVESQNNQANSSLYGTIAPNSFSRLNYLIAIDLQGLVGLKGGFPDFVFRLPRLEFIYIVNCGLSGKLPSNIGNLSRLNTLNLEGNGFSGSIPSSVSRLSQLTQLTLTKNSFTGPIPDGIRNLTKLIRLEVGTNLLSGPLPDAFLSLSELIILDLSDNRFSGKIPSSISALAPNLTYLYMGFNNLTGTIPEFFGKFRSLDTMNLSWNSLSGAVPKSFANLTKIFNLDLSHNMLVDPFPEMYVLGIETLDLSHNNFHLKRIPKWVTSSPIIYSLKLAKCGITIKLDDWNPSQTYFYDYINLSENEITGSAVKLLNATNYLVGFYAYGNKLKFDFGMLRVASTMKYLDLSRNLMFGKVPKNVTGVDALQVSYNHLCGRLPVAKFPASSYVGNDCLCGSPLPPCKA